MAAPSVTRARRDGDRERRAESLRQVIELISGELALEPLLTRIVESAVELTGSLHGAIGLVRESDDAPTITWLAMVGMPLMPRGMETRGGDGLGGAVLDARGPVQLARYGDLDSPIDHPGIPGIEEHAVVGIPIPWAQRITGVFTLGARPPRRYDERDVETLTLFARHAAIAIQNARLYGDLQNSLATTRLLYETSRRIGAAMGEDEVIAAYLDHVAAGSPYHCSIALYETDADGTRTSLLIRRRPPHGEPGAFEQIRLPYATWAPGLDHLIDAGETVTIRDVRTDARVSGALRRRHLEAGLPAGALIPLIAGERRLGFVGLTYPLPHDWRAVDLRPFEATAAQLAGAIAGRRQQLALQEQERQIAVLKERGRLARELHDSVTQSLAGISLLAQTLPALWEIDRGDARASLVAIRDQTREALAEMRALLVELRPAAETGQSLAATLRRHAAAFERRSGVPVRAALDDGIVPPEPVAHALARIAQEALANAARHAAAAHVSLTLSGGPVVRLVIADDGRGFDVTREQGTGNREQGARAGGFGLTSMRERAAGIGARLRIDAAPGRGTTITVEWPAAGDATV